MKKHNNVQFITNQGKPQWAVIPYEDFLHYQELAAIANDVKHFKKALAAGKEELVDSDFAKRLVSGENAIKVWRQYRGLKQAKLAELAQVSVPYLSQIENGERRASVAVLKRLAKALQLAVDDLVD